MFYFAWLIVTSLTSSTECFAVLDGDSIYVCGNNRVLSAKFPDLNRSKMLFVRNLSDDQETRAIKLTDLGEHDNGRNTWKIDKKRLTFVSYQRPDLGGTAYLANVGQLKHFPLSAFEPQNLVVEKPVKSLFAVLPSYQINGPEASFAFTGFKDVVKRNRSMDVLTNQNGSVDGFVTHSTEVAEPLRKTAVTVKGDSGLLLRHYRFDKTIEDTEYSQVPSIMPSQEHWVLKNQWKQPFTGSFRVGAMIDGYFFVSAEGKIYITPEPKPLNEKPTTTPQLECLWDRSPIVSVIYDSASGKSFAFTSADCFEITRTLQVHPHGMELTRQLTIDKLMKQNVRCAKYLRLLNLATNAP